MLLLLLLLLFQAVTVEAASWGRSPSCRGWLATGLDIEAHTRRLAGPADISFSSAESTLEVLPK